MGIVQKNTILSELTVRETMRRQVISLPLEADLAACINRLIKFKVNALLITGEGMAPVGVVSKTDIMGAYYAGLPIDLPAGDIMISPPLFCRLEDTLEAALEQMRHHGVYRLYVQGEGNGAAGVIAYPDIAGILYQYCHECKYSRLRRSDKMGADPVLRFRVKDVMSPSVRSCGEDESLTRLMEGLSEYRMGAVLVDGRRGGAGGGRLQNGPGPGLQARPRPRIHRPERHDFAGKVLRRGGIPGGRHPQADLFPDPPHLCLSGRPFPDHGRFVAVGCGQGPVRFVPCLREQPHHGGRTGIKKNGTRKQVPSQRLHGPEAYPSDLW